MVTKEDELNALNEIRIIVSRIGIDSYVGTALEGCLEIAECNIANDELCSMKQKWLRELNENAKKDQNLLELTKKLKDRDSTILYLREKIEQEEEWKPYVDKGNISDKEYLEIRELCNVEMSELQAVKYVSDEFGFCKDRINILYVRTRYEINRHNVLRKCGEEERKPCYFATDVNYVRFKCGGYVYEVCNGTLKRGND